MPEDEKYKTFEIPKKYGGQRTIQAPHPRLSLLQKRLARMLYACVEEHKKENPRFWFASHGFQKKRTIVTNAHVHRRRRFVFNLDLKDFFGTINFGRVRGFFMSDKMFELNKDVATVIAQIACHENKLPQGSPCSPIISNLIGNILDSRLLALARDTQCTYTRYADDLTFSINKELFPSDIAVEIENGEWDVGKKLHKKIKDTGFTINASKTRMSLKQSRQTVTGLVVNKKVNIKKEYYLNTRAMCNSLFQTGSYHKPYDETETKMNNLNHLEGTLSHIYFVKGRRDRKDKINRELENKGVFHQPIILKNLYKKFLFYKYFVVPSVPLIITEGSTDIAYIKKAIRLFAVQFPSLVATKKNGKSEPSVSFFNSTRTLKDVLNLTNGTDGQIKLINYYEKKLKEYKHNPPIKPPIIILCDNDKGAEGVFKAVNAKSNHEISTETIAPFYKIFENLYLIKIPEGKNPKEGRPIEKLFSERLLGVKLNGKSFSYKNEINQNTEYDKNYFTENVVSKATDPKDFDGFKELLERIQAVIDDHKV